MEGISKEDIENILTTIKFCDDDEYIFSINGEGTPYRRKVSKKEEEKLRKMIYFPSVLWREFEEATSDDYRKEIMAVATSLNVPYSNGGRILYKTKNQKKNEWIKSKRIGGDRD